MLGHIIQTVIVVIIKNEPMFSVVIQTIDGALSEKYSRIHTLGCFYVLLHIWYQWKMSD